MKQIGGVIIKIEEYQNNDEEGRWDVARIVIGEDMYIDVAMRCGADSRAAAMKTAKDVQAAIFASMEQHNANKK